MRMRAGKGVLYLILSALGCSALGCVPLAGGWSPDVLASLEPAIALPKGHRLGDTPPHFWPDGARAWLFLCRFDTKQPIEVAIPASATDDERAEFRLALDAWERAVAGVRFRFAAPERAQIVIRYDDAAASGAAPPRGTGLTVTDCEVSARSGRADSEVDASVEAPKVLEARLVRASVFLRRSNTDTLGREVPLPPDARLGAVLHEIGHALGFAGHVGDQGSIMSVTAERTRGLARRIRAGEPMREPSLAALYAVPNGTIVGGVSLSPQAQQDLVAARDLAATRRWRGPFVRVGDRNAQLHYRRGESMAGRLAVIDYPRQLRSSAPLDFSSTALVRFTRAKRAAAVP